MTNIYKNIYLRREEEVLYNIRKNVDETVVRTRREANF